MPEITPTPNVGTILELTTDFDPVDEYSVGTVLRLTVNFDPVDEYSVGTVLRLTVGFGRRGRRGLGLVR
jgi:hypothetical protein